MKSLENEALKPLVFRKYRGRTHHSFRLYSQEWLSASTRMEEADSILESRVWERVGESKAIMLCLCSAHTHKLINLNDTYWFFKSFLINQTW